MDTKKNHCFVMMLIIAAFQPMISKGRITITSYPRPLLVELGTTFALSCDYNSYTFHSWVHPTEGEITGSQGRFQFSNLPDIHIATLQVDSATIEDEGVYVCRAVTDDNVVFNKTITAFLFERVQVTTESMLSYEARLCEPVVLNCTALHHDSIIWRRQIPHYPAPREIRNSSDGRITVSSETGQLVIREVKLSDNGTYFCAASNRVSSKEAIAYLNIERISLELLPGAATIYIDDTAFNFTEISFNWDRAIGHQCSDVLYRINTTDCGTCPITTNLTMATCSVIRDETAKFNYDNHSMTCIFAIQTVIHGSTIGHQTILSAIKLSDLVEEFVNIEFNQTTSDIQCNFHNQQESFFKSCSVVFGPGKDCRNLSQSISEDSTTNNSVLVYLNIEQDSNDNRIDCFHVTATNGSLTVVTKKIFNISHSDTNTALESLPTAVSCNPIDLSDGTLLDLTLSNNTMTCGVKSLSALRMENGIVCYSGSNVGAIAVYSCLSCRFTGSSYETFIRMCAEDGNWTGTTPQCDCTGYFISVSTLSISVGSVLLVLSVTAFTLLLLSVALCRAKAKPQEKLKAPAHLEQDQLYDEVNIHHVRPEDVDTQPNISYATHRKL